MFKFTLQHALRNLLRHPGFLGINLLGFGLGVACAFLSLLYAWQEYRVDRGIAGGERIYRIGCSFMNMGGFASGPEQLIPEITAACPAVEAGTRLKKYSSESIRVGKRSFEEKDVLYVDSVFFRMFDYPFLAGSRDKAMTGTDQVILSETLAHKYFGDEPAIGQTLYAGEAGREYRVAGVVGEPAQRSHLDGTLWLPIYSKLQNKPNAEWYGAAFYSYVRLRPGAGQADLEQSLERLRRERVYPPFSADASYEVWAKGQNGFSWIVQPFRDIYLKSRLMFEAGGGGDPDKVYGLLLIGFFILLIAMMNYVNLVTARAALRAREIGIRKTLGVSHAGLVRDLLAESALFGLGAAVVGLFAAEGLMAVFKAITDTELLDLTRYRWLLNAGIAVFAVPVSILTGLYPALFLARFKPAAVLKGQWGLQGNKPLRSALVVGQFAIALVLLTGSLGVYRQLDFMQQRDWGFQRAGICVVENTDLLGEQAQSFQTELKRQNGVEASCLVASLPAASTTFFKTYRTPEMSQPLSIKSFMVSPDFIPTLGMRLVGGRNFNADMATDTAAVILNEAAVRALGLGDNPLGAEVNKGEHVVGVVSDFNYETLRNPVGPLVLQNKPGTQYYAIARVQPQATAGFLQAAGNAWQRLASGKPFSYYFLDENLAELSEKENAMGKGILFFTALALFIACLGLFGLATFLTGQRSKEIGIRKVLGASVRDIVTLLSGDFMKLVLLSFVLATPLAWYGLERWLQDFAYRTELAWWIPAVAGAAVMLVALGTVSLQCVRAALVNPVETLQEQ